MIFGKHINKYYLKYLWMLLIGLVALVAVDYFQLLIPEYLRTVLNGINTGEVIIDGRLRRLRWRRCLRTFVFRC